MPQVIKDYSQFDVQIDGLALLEKRIDYDGGTSPVYVGYTRQPDEATDAAVWFLIKMTNDGNGNPTRVQLPDDGVQFKYTWDDRATYFS